MEQTVKQLTIFFYDELWTTLIPQLAQSDECIQRAVVTLSMHHEGYADSGSNGEKSRALREYNRAIKCVHQIAPNLTSLHLLSCALSICVEALRNGHNSIPAHRRTNDGILALAQPFFTRLAFQITVLLSGKGLELSTLDNGITAATRLSPITNFHFTKLADARDSLQDFALNWIRRGSCSREELRGHHATLVRWGTAYENFHAINQSLPNGLDEKSGHALLEMHRRYLLVEISAAQIASIQDPIVWDAYTAELADVLGYGELAIRLAFEGKEHTDGARIFHMDTGIVTVAFLIAMRCRDPLIRRRALALLSLGPLQEGVWNRTLASQAAYGLIALEEHQLKVAMSCDDIPRESRVTQVSACISDGQSYVRAQLEKKSGIAEHDITLEQLPGAAAME
ncbi:hypothetical protein NLG97_g3373 [Lecanicillium saksenae]|uniref:Uncharacterized protein n=1 Tax=Lecanicillium saksenae TaxID=468837 RepID=A0ACC1R0Z0_9HYPO|nr:hypothetical protein NLG97_g3373 [Lecanicillium saksenae]